MNPKTKSMQKSVNLCKTKTIEEFESLMWSVYSAHEEPHSSSAVVKYAVDFFTKALKQTRDEAYEEMRMEERKVCPFTKEEGSEVMKLSDNTHYKIEAISYNSSVRKNNAKIDKLQGKREG